jgi:signal transduction histidine kinase
VSGPPRRVTLRTRLVVGNFLLVASALASTWAVITLTGPPLFHDRIARGAPLPAAVLKRAEDAFHIANLVENLIATAVAFALTLGLSMLVTRPVRRIITAINATAQRFDVGDYAARLPRHSPIPELASLSTTVNAMAETIQNTEATRRRMLTDLAHELRTPLATVDGLLEAIEDGVESPDPPTIAILRSQLRKLTRLAEDLRAISAADERRLHLDLQPTSANEVIREAAEALHPAYVAKGVTLEVVEAPPTTIQADPQRLGQVITNLLDNALRHTTAGGLVTIHLMTMDAIVRITVQDDGEGVSPEHLPHLFERFYRAHPRAYRADQGSGIGLTISRAIITAHAGTIQIESPGPGAGVTACIDLPGNALEHLTSLTGSIRKIQRND